MKIYSVPTLKVSDFPKNWWQFFDETVLAWVKKNYSPKSPWKERPFQTKDVEFFSRGVLELSEIFTTSRSGGDHFRGKHYFGHPRFRSAYLLYFFQLQASKFLNLYRYHSDAFYAAVDHGLKNKKLTFVDYGSGPGTASFAFLLKLMDELPISEWPAVEFYWIDQDRKILADGESLLKEWIQKHPALISRIQIFTYQNDWWKMGAKAPSQPSLQVFGHVLNETFQEQHHLTATLLRLIENSDGGGTLIVEPALKEVAHSLSQLRDLILKELSLMKNSNAIWGPCLHADICPASRGRDWCHFSIPAEFKSKWFNAFSEELGSKRDWIKFSYLWFASSTYPAIQSFEKDYKRVISDPLSQNKKSKEILICEPQAPKKIQIPADKRAKRGDLIKP